MVMMTPVPRVQAARKTGGARRTSTSSAERAFAVQAVAVTRELGLDPARVNVNGGAVALGHAIGASGARILTTLLYALRDRGLRRGIATLCLGGGNGVALAVEAI
jgi:acetyl-CoA C-acetyltransferase